MSCASPRDPGRWMAAPICAPTQRRPAIKSAKSCPGRVINAASYRARASLQVPSFSLPLVRALFLTAGFIDPLNRTARTFRGGPLTLPSCSPGDRVGVVQSDREERGNLPKYRVRSSLATDISLENIASIEQRRQSDVS